MNIESRWATNEENKPIALCTTASSVFLEDGTSLENYLKTIGGGDGNGFHIEKLLDGNITEVGEYDLLANIDNYDMILVTADVVLSNSHEQLASLIIMKEDYYYQGAEDCGHAINSSINGSTRRIIFYFSSESKINIVLNEKLALKKVYGVKLSSSSGSSLEIKTNSGTFTSPTTSQGTVHIDLGFKPDIISVFLPLNNKNTCSYFNKFIRNDGAYWDLRPAENNNYFNNFESATGETGICGIDETGFTFRTNSANTFNKECSYIAYKI